MSLSPQLRTAVEQARAEGRLAPLLTLIANGYRIDGDEAREIDALLPINAGRPRRDAFLAVQMLKFRARYRIAYLKARAKPSAEIDERAFESVLAKFKTMPDGRRLERSEAEALARGRGRANVNALVRRHQRRSESQER